MTDPNRGGENPAPQFGGYEGPPATGPYAPQPQYPANPYAQPYPPGNPYAQPYPPANPYAQPYPYGGYPPAPAPGTGRPGTTIAAAVLGYVAAGLLIAAGIFLFFGASFVNNFDDNDYDDGVPHHWVVELAVNGVFNLIAAGLLIAGAVAMAGRNRNGRVMFSVGTGIVIVEAIYWLVRWSDRTGGAIIFYALLYAALVIIGASLAWTTGVSRWLRGATDGLPVTR